jgi:hypothetical protein
MYSAARGQARRSLTDRELNGVGDVHHPGSVRLAKKLRATSTAPAEKFQELP